MLHELIGKPTTKRARRVQAAARAMAEIWVYMLAFAAFATADLLTGASWIVGGCVIGALWKAPDLIDCAVELRRARRASAGDAVTGPGRPPLLSEQEFAQRCRELATPVEIDEPEQPPDPTPRALCDGAWDRWRDAKSFRNGPPALDRPFTLVTDCRVGHVGEHLMGDTWDAFDGRRVVRFCRFTCHSTWSEIV